MAFNVAITSVLEKHYYQVFCQREGCGFVKVDGNVHDGFHLEDALVGGEGGQVVGVDADDRNRLLPDAVRLGGRRDVSI